MERAEIERFKRRLESLEPTPENLKRVAAARGNPVDPRMLNEEVREITARFLLLETDSPADPGRAFRAALFLDSGNGDVSKEILADIAENHKNSKNREKFARGRLYRDPTQAEDEVLSAAYAAMTKKLFRLVAEGAGLNAKDENGMTPLMHCISSSGTRKVFQRSVYCETKGVFLWPI